MMDSLTAADATPARKDACLAEVNSAADSGSDTTMATYLVLGLGFGVKGFGGLVVTPAQPRIYFLS
jgi:4-amino-4-deoxy-L-arabinose transferase-like glycosyltransferase